MIYMYKTVSFVVAAEQSKSSEKMQNESDLHRDMEQWKPQQLILHKVVMC